MGEAKRRRAAGATSPPAAPEDNTVGLEQIVRTKAVSDRISAALADFNALRQLKGEPPAPRALFVGMLLLPHAVEAYEQERAKVERANRLVVSPDEVRRTPGAAPMYAPVAR